MSSGSVTTLCFLFLCRLRFSSYLPVLSPLSVSSFSVVSRSPPLFPFCHHSLFPLSLSSPVLLLSSRSVTTLCFLFLCRLPFSSSLPVLSPLSVSSFSVVSRSPPIFLFCHHSLFPLSLSSPVLLLSSRSVTTLCFLFLCRLPFSSSLPVLSFLETSRDIFTCSTFPTFCYFPPYTCEGAKINVRPVLVSRDFIGSVSDVPEEAPCCYRACFPLFCFFWYTLLMSNIPFVSNLLFCVCLCLCMFFFFGGGGDFEVNTIVLCVCVCALKLVVGRIPRADCITS